MFLSSFCSKPLIWVPVSFTSLLVSCPFSFMSLFIAFTFSSILRLNSTNSVSLLITSVLTCASDRLAISLSISCIFSGALKIFLIYFIDYAIIVVPPPLYSSPPCTSPPTYIPPLWFMSIGHTYKFFGFYISYTILTLLLSIFYLLPFMLLILCTFPLSLPLPLPYWYPSMWSPFLWFCSCSSCLLSLLLVLF